MTELYIDGQQVVLPDDFNLVIRSENPFYTKNGEYTYELTLSLDNPVNSSLYKHLNRFNTSEKIEGKRPAVLIADNRVLCNGTEVITGWDDESVSIQIVAGNSELNYLLTETSSKLISSLDMGKATIELPIDILKNDLTWYKSDFCFFPIKSGDKILNNWKVTITLLNTGNDNDFSYRYDYSLSENIYAQPYLIPYLKKVLQALGYTVELDEIEDEWRALVICQDGDPEVYSKMLPGWTVGEFIQAVETFLNICLIVDARTKKVSMYSRHKFSEHFGVQYIEVTDEFETQDEETEVDDPTSFNIRIDGTGSDYYKLQHIEQDYIKKKEKKVLDSMEAIQAEVKLKGKEFYKDTLFQASDTERFFIVDQRNVEMIDSPVMEVNMLCDWIRNEEFEDLNLDCIPSDYVDNVPYVIGESHRADYSVELLSTTNIPIVQLSSSASDEDTLPPNLYELILSGGANTDESKRNGKLFITFYNGMRACQYNVFVNYLFQGSDSYEGNHGLWGTYPGSNNIYASYGKDNTYSLRTKDLVKKLWISSELPHGDKPVKFTSFNRNLVNPKSTFIIRNKAYICKYIEYTLTAQGLSPMWQGVFSPYKVNEGEAIGEEWILSDGKWRDGGVWLDNGRWID